MAIVDAEPYLVRRRFGSVVGSRHRGATTLQRFNRGVNPCRGAQLVCRAAMARCRRAWNGELSEGQRDAWRSYGLSHYWYDRCSQRRTLRGIEWFCAVNVRRMRAGFEMVLDVPGMAFGSSWSWPEVTFVDEKTISVDFYYGVPGGSRMACWSTGPVGPGVGVGAIYPTWERYALPSHYAYVGVGGDGEGPPVEYSLPWAVAAGEGLWVIGCMVNESWLYDYLGEWSPAFAVYEP